MDASIARDLVPESSDCISPIGECSHQSAMNRESEGAHLRSRTNSLDAFESFYGVTKDDKEREAFLVPSAVPEQDPSLDISASSNSLPDTQIISTQNQNISSIISRTPQESSEAKENHESASPERQSDGVLVRHRTIRFADSDRDFCGQVQPEQTGETRQEASAALKRKMQRCETWMPRVQRLVPQGGYATNAVWGCDQKNFIACGGTSLDGFVV